MGTKTEIQWTDHTRSLRTAADRLCMIFEDYLARRDAGEKRWTASGKRHEYDHINGYSGDAALQVEAVCARCHHRRGRERGTHLRAHGANGRFFTNRH